MNQLKFIACVFVFMLAFFVFIFLFYQSGFCVGEYDGEKITDKELDFYTNTFRISIMSDLKEGSSKGLTYSEWRQISLMAFDSLVKNRAICYNAANAGVYLNFYQALSDDFRIDGQGHFSNYQKFYMERKRLMENQNKNIGPIFLDESQLYKEYIQRVKIGLYLSQLLKPVNNEEIAIEPIHQENIAKVDEKIYSGPMLFYTLRSVLIKN